METTTRHSDLTFAQAWSKLDDLQRNSNVTVADIPEVFHDDLNAFLVGKTQPGFATPGVISGGTYCGWLLKLYKQGLYYNIQFKVALLP